VTFSFFKPYDTHFVCCESGRVSGAQQCSVCSVVCSLVLLLLMCCVQRLVAMSEVGVGGVSVEVPEMCVDGSAACLVCGDKGSGFHYSVFSCEGCKVCQQCH